MPTITIQRASFDRDKPWSEEIEADIHGSFAIHQTAGLLVDKDDFTVTHVPTGFAYLSGIPKDHAERAVKEINAGKFDWSLVKDPADLTQAHKKQGRAIRAKYRG